jgi:hypothetical protein
MKTHTFQLGFVHNLISRSSFIGLLIITIYHSIKNNQELEKNIFRYDEDITEIIYLFFIIILNITTFIVLKKIVSNIF